MNEQTELWKDAKLTALKPTKDADYLTKLTCYNEQELSVENF